MRQGSGKDYLATYKAGGGRQGGGDRLAVGTGLLHPELLAAATAFAARRRVASSQPRVSATRIGRGAIPLKVSFSEPASSITHNQALAARGGDDGGAGGTRVALISMAH